MIYENNALEKTTWKLKIDLCGDLQEDLYKRLKKSGYKEVDYDRAVYQYFNLQKRIVENKPRKIHKSKEFICPELYKEALAEFENKISRGESIIPFLSDKLEDASYSDGLLNDWNIHHFHLTRRFKQNGWAKRSDYELFAYVTDSDIYFIQIYSHKTPFLYSQKELVKIIHENWPFLIEKNKIKGVKSLAEKLNDEQYEHVRNAHAATFIEVGENEVFGLIGGGYMSDGSSGEAMRNAVYCHNRLKKIEINIIHNIPYLCDAINSMSQIAENEYEIRLLWIGDDHEFTFVECKHHVVIQYLENEGMFRICRPFEVFGELSYCSARVKFSSDGPRW